MPARPMVLGLLVAAALATACSKPPPEVLQLDGPLLTVNNQTTSDWTQVEIWLNMYYRVTVRTIPAGSRFQAPLDAFVSGFSQRFNFHTAQVKDLRLTAKQDDGTAIEIKKAFTVGGLAGAFGRK